MSVDVGGGRHINKLIGSGMAEKILASVSDKIAPNTPSETSQQEKPAEEKKQPPVLQRRDIPLNDDNLVLRGTGSDEQGDFAEYIDKSTGKIFKRRIQDRKGKVDTGILNRFPVE